MTDAFRRVTESLEALTAGDTDGQRLARATRIAEALLFAAREPLTEEDIGRALPAETDVRAVMSVLAAQYDGRGINLRRLAGKWAFHTAPDLGYLLTGTVEEPKKLGRAALETLAVIAYHQPVTRAEIEDIRGLQLSRGMLDFLLEAGWVKMRGRRRTPGRPVTYGTTEAFLIQFGLDKLTDLPGLDEMKGAGLVEGEAPGFIVPLPSDDPALRDDEDALEPDLFEAMTEERLAEEEPPLDPDSELPQEEGKEPPARADADGGP